MESDTNWIKEFELPSLIGSEKQIAWATTIREKKFKEIKEALSSKIETRQRPTGETVYGIRIGNRYYFVDLANRAAREMLSIRKAGYWIDNRGISYSELFLNIVIKIAREDEKKQQEQEKEAPKEEPVTEPEPVVEIKTIAPENCTKAGEVEITYNAESKEISCKYMRDDDFRKIVKSNGFAWNSENTTWDKQIVMTSGKVEDRIIEIANKLLNEGFVVTIPAELADRAVKAEYEPECKRWIVVLNNTKICIKINYGENDVYRAARKITGATWERGSGVIVPSSSYDEIRDFAEVYGYKLSPKTETILTEAEAERNKILDGAVKVSKQQTQDAEDRLKSKLEVTGIIDDLRDDN